MKKFIIAIVSFFMPFLLVWSMFILTAFSFNPREVFRADWFWIVSVFYWLMWLMITPIIMDMKEEESAA